MTEKTDIAALKRPVRERHDWSIAIWRDCDHCGKEHTGTVTAKDGSQICAHCAEQLYWSAWQALAERALHQLEEEHHRAVIISAGWLKAIESREKAEAELAELRGEQEPVAWIKCGEVTTEPTTADVWIREMNEGYGYDVEVLCKRQPKPVVVLSDCTFEAVSHMAHWYTEGECVAFVSGVEHAKKQMQAAGIVVKDEEKPRCHKCGGRGAYHCPQVRGTVECECGIVVKDGE